MGLYPGNIYSPWGGSSDAVPSFPAELNAGNKTGASSINVSAVLNQLITLTGNATLTINGLIAGKSQWGQLKVVQGGAGNFTLAIANSQSPGGLGLTLSTAAGSKDLVGFYWDGAALFVQVEGLAFS